MRNSLFLGVATAALIMPVAAMAQETTSTIRGSVTSGGAPVAGASVTIVNVPSGTTSATTTDANGNFNAAGLRVGGPFTVTVKAEGHPQTSITDINTVVAQAFDLPIDLQPAQGVETAAGGDVVVTAAKLPNARTVSQGPATVLSATQIAAVASVNRDVRDLMRRDPFARLDYSDGNGRAVSFAGQNARFNRFSIDGVPVTDNFGINPDGLPTRRSPVPLDAIGQFQTKVAPYDVREGNFQGGAINAILKSGTNQFHGTGFYAYSSDGLTGTKTKAGPGVPNGIVTLPKFKYENYGAELSGPIIKDKLFFMVAGERIRAGTPIAEGTPGNNAGTVIPNITDTQVSQIQDIAKSKYGYDTGGILNNSKDSDDRLVAKIDANISDRQRVSLTYMYTKDSIQFGTSPALALNPTAISRRTDCTLACSSSIPTGATNSRPKFALSTRIISAGRIRSSAAALASSRSVPLPPPIAAPSVACRAARGPAPICRPTARPAMARYRSARTSPASRTSSPARPGAGWSRRA